MYRRKETLKTLQHIPLTSGALILRDPPVLFDIDWSRTLVLKKLYAWIFEDSWLLKKSVSVKMGKSVLVGQYVTRNLCHSGNERNAVLFLKKRC